MKTRLFKQLTLLFVLLVTATGMAQESCSSYYPINKGVRYEVTTYDKKNNALTLTKNEIVAVTDGIPLKATVHTTVTNLKKDKTTVDANFHILCSGGKITMDLNEMLQETMQEQLDGKDASVAITGTDFELPNNLEVGQGLPDIKTDIAVKSGAINMNFHIYTTDRKVIGRESVTTPAGTFECLVITQNVDTKMLFAKNTTTKIWIAEGVGMVKQEDYKSSGKLDEYQMLTAFSN
ncbi:DUF3108 domain-containing protein [Leeuwenhoekiella polynyae]|uniref:DUF3108 domain-containing protein n=1 Tax=Leeuwenhoekiella polynyae TaxID=1550906 RepID=A0A4Q0PED9_9FLAO|nr:DUF3108 domain-containing protein [Leeuwenhoekiella polynyae]RXG25260.1 putative protein DUF3108 [Leeuwenhoekiella polynyae]|tara:strand:+ start:313 stop:1017 length:705 start_codon:yes stop_codon:yes gene_type:complete